MSLLERNGYARFSDLSDPDYASIFRELENFQSRFVGLTRPLWTPSFAFSGDDLVNWSRRWEYPYTVANLRSEGGRVLDAGSGITFLPYYLASRGSQVFCCDIDASLSSSFDAATRSTGTTVDFKVGPIESLPYEDSFFDEICCVSVLEHAPDRRSSIAELRRVLKPGGRLVLTCDLCLSGDRDIIYADLSVLLIELQEAFEPAYPMDLSRPTDLLTTSHARSNEPWRLPWKPPTAARGAAQRIQGKKTFHDLAVLGLTLVRAGE